MNIPIYKILFFLTIFLYLMGLYHVYNISQFRSEENNKQKKLFGDTIEDKFFDNINKEKCKMITGKEFNEMYPNELFFTLIKNSDIKHEIKNKKTWMIKGTDLEIKRGLYLELGSNIEWWTWVYDKMLILSLPDDAKVCIKENHFRINKGVIKDIKDISYDKMAHWLLMD